MLWLIAAEYDDGTITATAEDIAWRLRMSSEEFSAAVKPLLDKGFFVSDRGAITPLAERKQQTLPEREVETQVQAEEEKIGGGEGSAPAKSKSLISPEAFETASNVLVAMGLDPHHPLSVGAPLTIQGWFNEHWRSECILIGVKRGMQSRNGDPPGTLKYFEKAIARAHAELSPSLPTVEFREAEKVTVTRHGTSQNSVVAVAKRLAEQFESQSGNGIEGNPNALLRIPAG
jgi:hypothetical protein